MKNQLKFASAVLAGLMVVGCDKKDNTTTTTTPPAAVPSTNATDTLRNGATNVQNSVSDMANKAKDTAGDMATQAQTTTSSATGTAQTKLQQVGELMAEKKYDAADAALKQVEAMKGSLPPAMQQQVTSLRTQLDAAKAANGAGMTLPSLPAGK